MAKLRFIKNANRLHSEVDPKHANMVNLDAAKHAGIKTVPVTKKEKFLGGTGVPDGTTIETIVSGSLMNAYSTSVEQPEGTKVVAGKTVPLNVTATEKAYADFYVIVKQPKTGSVDYTPESGNIVFYPFSITSGVVVTATDADFAIIVDGVSHTITTNANMTAEANIDTTGKLDTFVAEIQAQTPSISGITWSREGNYLKVTVANAELVRIAGAATPFAYKLTSGNTSTPANDFYKVYNGAIAVVDNSALATANYTAAVAEVSSVDTIAAATMASGDYFSISTPAKTYYVWYNKDGGGNAPVVTTQVLVEVAIANADTNAQVATKTKAALDAVRDYANVVGGVVFSTAISTNQLTITNKQLGVAANAADGTSATGFTIATDVQGTNESDLDALAADLNTNSHHLKGIFDAVGNYLTIKAAGQIIIKAGDMTNFLGFTAGAASPANDFNSNNQGAVELSHGISRVTALGNIKQSNVGALEADADSSGQRYKDYTVAGGKAAETNQQII